MEDETLINKDAADNTTEQAEKLLQSLQLRADRLITELKEFQAYLQEHGKHREVEIRVFRKGVESEIKSIQTISKQHQSIGDAGSPGEDGVASRSSRYIHALKSSNLPFYEAVWHTARQSRGIAALGKKMYRTKNVHHLDQSQSKANPVKKDIKISVVVDVVAEGGLAWTKVSTITEKRLLFDMAKEGWEVYDESESEGSTSDRNRSKFDNQDEYRLELVQIAYDLRSAALAQRVRHQHPKVRFVLPHIREGRTKEIDDVLRDIRSTGATVVSKKDFATSEVNAAFDRLELNSLDSRFAQLLPTPAVKLTSTLNIDCTVLLALISDISHFTRPNLPPFPRNQSNTYHTAILRQIDTEEASPLLETEMYGLLNNCKLVCTNHAAKRMKEIARTMGTNSELERTTILFGERAYSSLSPQQLKSALQETSHYRVPEGLQLPIQIVHFEGAESELVQQSSMNISPTELDVLRSIVRMWGVGPGIKTSLINRSVFIYGWCQSITTITSNRVVAAGLNRMINELLDKNERDLANQKVGVSRSDDVVDKAMPIDQFIGPMVYLCETARSLIGKEKQTKCDS